MAELQRQEGEQSSGNPAAPHAATGHPSLEQLTREQGTGAIADVSVLHGDLWPELDSIEEFLATLHDWRGHLEAVKIRPTPARGDDRRPRLAGRPGSSRELTAQEPA